MKRLVTMNDIKGFAQAGQEKILYVEPGTIVTPAARDAANECGIKIEFGCCPPKNEPCLEVVEEKNDSNIGLCLKNLEISCKEKEGPEAWDQALVSLIVKEVMASLAKCNGPKPIEKECDSQGLILVKGDTVECEAFDTGNPQNNVRLREILTQRESPNMAPGFMTMEKSSFEWNLGYEEIDYIIEGTLDITINGKTYRGKTGDVFYIPKGSHIVFSTPDKVKFLFITYPANWAELSK